MPDRERVIDWLHKVGEALAKYVPAKEQDYFKLQQTVDIAIAWIRAQEAIDPHIERDSDDDTWYYGCGACHNDINPGDAYCRHCGRKVKW